MTRQTYPIARYHFLFEVTQTIRLPEYAGSMLRGAFGQALRRTSCIVREKNCKDCPLFRTCPYTAIFEAPAPQTHSLQAFSQIPAPYIIEPPEWGMHIYGPGEPLAFSMVLVGKALEHLALVTYAWQRAFDREVGHGKARLNALYIETPTGKEKIYDGTSQTIIDHDPRLDIVIEPVASARLTFTTPLRLQDNGHALPPAKLTARRFMMALIRRIALLSEFHMDSPINTDFHALSQQAEQIQDARELTWRDWTRYSSRQRQTMQLGGVIGTWTMKDIPESCMAYLHLGQWLHVGKNATFGLGQYKMEKA